MRNLFFVILFCLLNLLGCETIPEQKISVKPAMPGVYHKVERGQTLWRISKMYGVDLDDLAKINRISDNTSIEIGQMIFIPSLNKPQAIPVKNALSDDFIWPLKGKVVSGFGQTHNNIINKGLNIAPRHTEDISASRAGRVSFYSDDLGSFGKTIIIDHGDGYSTVYSRNKEVFVKAGDTVQKGTLIAKAGSSGRDRSTYLHFEIRKGHIPQNPYLYLP